MPRVRSRPWLASGAPVAPGMGELRMESRRTAVTSRRGCRLRSTRSIRVSARRGRVRRRRLDAEDAQSALSEQKAAERTPGASKQRASRRPRRERAGDPTSPPVSGSSLQAPTRSQQRIKPLGAVARSGYHQVLGAYRRRYLTQGTECTRHPYVPTWSLRAAVASSRYRQMVSERVQGGDVQHEERGRIGHVARRIRTLRILSACACSAQS